MAADKMETKLTALINTNKKNVDAAINANTRDIKKMESTMEEWMRTWKNEMEAWRKERAEWRTEKLQMQEEIYILKNEIASLRSRPTREEGEICEEDKAAIKEELTKAITETLEVKTKALEGMMEAKQEGWVEVVKKNLRKEAKEEVQKDIVHTTLEEEKMRQARRLNIRVSGIQESKDSTPEEDGRALCTKLGYKVEDPLPFTKAWRVGKDTTKTRALLLQFPSELARTTFMKKKVILRGLREEPIIYLDDDLTKMQQDHRRACMPRVHQARKEGKRAMYRDGRVIIDGKAVN